MKSINPSERRRLRTAFLRRLYDVVDSSVSEFVCAYDIGGELGLSQDDARKVMEYHEEKGFLFVDDHKMGIIRITARGVDEVEEAAG